MTEVVEFESVGGIGGGHNSLNLKALYVIEKLLDSETGFYRRTRMIGVDS